MSQPRSIRVLSIVLAASVLFPALSGCIPQEQYERARSSLSIGTDGTKEASFVADAMSASRALPPKSTRDILGELGQKPSHSSPISSPQPGSPSPEPKPSPAPPERSPKYTHTPEENATEEGSPSPSASSQVLSPSPTPFASSEAEGEKPTNGVLPHEVMPEDVVYLPLWTSIYFGMDQEALKAQFEGESIDSNGNLGAYLTYPNIHYFPEQTNAGEGHFYFDDNTLTMFAYEYAITSAEAPLSEDTLANVRGDWDMAFGGNAVATYFDAWGMPRSQGGLYEALASNGSALLVWYGNELDVLAKVDNGIGADACSATFYFQPAQTPVIDIPAPQVCGSWTAQALLAYFARNELAAETNLEGLYVQLTGEINSIARNGEGNAYIALSNEQSGPVVTVYFSEEELETLLPLAVGEAVFLEGRILGMTEETGSGQSILALDKCRIIERDRYEAQEAYLYQMNQDSVQNEDSVSGE